MLPPTLVSGLCIFALARADFDLDLDLLLPPLYLYTYTMLLRAAPSTSRSALRPLARAFAAPAAPAEPSSSASAANEASSSSSTSTPASPAEASTSAPSSPAESSSATPANAGASPARDVRRPRTLGYIVERSASGNLPVYSEYRNARSNRLTVIRKITGNAGLLRNDIAQYLADGHIDPLKAPPKVVLRPTSQHVEIKGLWVEEVKEWLAARGF